MHPALLLVLAGLFMLAVPATPAAAQPAEVTVDLADTRQVVHGFGASSAWYERRVGEFEPDGRDRLLRFIFDPDQGLGLSILRLRIDPKHQEEPPAGEAFRYTWDSDRHQAAARFIREAAAYRPIIFGSPWSPPVWMKTTDDVKHGGYLQEGRLDDYARYLAAWARSMRETVGVAVDVLSIQNEPGRKPWESLEWETADLIALLAEHLPAALAEAGVEVLVLADEETKWNDERLNAILQDEAAGPQVEIAGSHTYNFGKPPEDYRPFPLVREKGLPLWMTEYFYEGKGNALERGLRTAQRVHEFFTIAEGNAYLFWWLFSPPDKGAAQRLIMIDRETSSFTPEKQAYAFGQFSRFVRPGFVRLGVTTSDLPADVFVTAFADPAGGSGRLAIIANNVTDAEQLLRLQIRGAASPQLVPHRTSASEDLLALSSVTGEGEGTTTTFGVTLPPRSITTFVNPGFTAEPGNPLGDELWQRRPVVSRP